MFPGILPENVGHDIAEIKQNPLAGSNTFNTQWPLAHVGKRSVDMVGDSPCLSVRFRRCNHQVVSHRGQWGDVQYLDIDGLLVEHGFADGKGGGLRRLCDRNPPDTSDDAVYKIRPGAATDLPGSFRS